MSDPAFNWLLETLRQNQGRSAAWFMDENADESWRALTPEPGIQLYSNRWDLAHEAQARGWKAHFNDLDLSALADNSLDRVYYRVSKEKPLVHHLCNQAWRCLKPTGQLFIAGLKNEGTKTYIDKLVALWGAEKNTEKQGLTYVAKVTKNQAYQPQQLLDTSDYPLLRPIQPPPEVADHLGELQLFSKPGQFGWNKVDQGSWLLVQHLAEFIASLPLTPQKCLDLGCGYGFLSLAASRVAQCQSIKQWLLTDNNAAALDSAVRNMRQIAASGTEVRVFGDNCAASLQEKMDVIICNPPFHQGFSVESELTDRFLQSTKRLLAPKGAALFVVNQFIPLERKAKGLFREQKTLADNGRFKLVGLYNY